MTVGPICSREVDLADLHEPVSEAARRMRERGVGTLVVLDDDKRPIGIVTDRDLVLRVLAEDADAKQTRVGDVMTRDPVTVREDGPIEGALAAMRQGVFRRVPVVDADGALVGLISLDDILSLLAEEFHDIGGLVDRESPRSSSVQPRPRGEIR